MDERLLTAKEVATIFRMTAPTSAIKILQWARAKKLRGFKIGRNILFKEADIEAFIKKQEVR